MSIAYRYYFIALLVLAIAVPLSLAAQSKGEGAALSEPQRTGKRLYLQNCALCHNPAKKNNKDPNDEGILIGPRLNGLFSGPNAVPDAVARTFIQKGVADKMPGFQYGLEPKEIDALIAYLKTL